MNEYVASLEAMLARPFDADGLAGYLAENSRLPGPRGNLELAAAFANVMSNSTERSGWYPVVIGWAATPADVVPTNDPREYLPFCALFALGAVNERLQCVGQIALSGALGGRHAAIFADAPPSRN